MTKTEIAKKIVKFVVGTSTAYTVTSIIKNNTAPAKRHQKVEAAVGGVVVGAMVSEQAEDWTDRKIDELVASFQTIKKPIK